MNKATLWLYLCPIFGFFVSSLITKEPISSFTIVGTALVLIGKREGKTDS